MEVAIWNHQMLWIVQGHRRTPQTPKEQIMEFRNMAASAATVVAFASAAFAHKGSRLTPTTLQSRLAAARPFLIAHRGCTALAPENTVPSFLCAARLGLHAIETDVRLAADGALVCIHDDTPARMFGCERPVAEMRPFLQLPRPRRRARGTCRARPRKGRENLLPGRRHAGSRRPDARPRPRLHPHERNGAAMRPSR